ncbi:MAG TPA: hypothetical protein VL285_05440 [Bryobacteraceae bacterium]|jgi:predicted ATP-grasp superfamily ATP-dependent carboligase|nr:hypothetical protein [Bryobacteraceae bacterium]
MSLPVDTSTPVVILRSAQHGGLAVARSLGRLGAPVYIVDGDPRTPGFFSRYCRQGFVWDFDGAPSERTVDYLLGIGRRLGRRALLIPTTDSGALFLASNAGPLRQSFLFPETDPELAPSLCSKQRMQALAAAAGVPSPGTFFPQSRREALDYAGRARYPVILKAVEGSAAKTIAREKRELIDAYQIMEDRPEHPNVMLQEYIPGGDEASWMFNGYFNDRSECLFGITGRKIRQNRPYAGITSLGVCEANPEVAEITRRFMKAIGYRGILDLGYRYDARDGRYKVFDVNPRIGCTFRLFVSSNGMDVARAWYLDMTGQRVEPGDAAPGRKWMVEDLDLASSFRYWRDGAITARQWLQSYRGIQESAFLSDDDPRPALARCVNDLLEIGRRTFSTPRRNSQEPAVKRACLEQSLRPSLQ